MPSFDDFVPKVPGLSTRDAKFVRNVTSSLTPEVLEAEHKSDLDPGNIAQLEAEIARTKDPKARDILVTEHNRIKGEANRAISGPSFADFTEHGNIKVDETDFNSALKSLKGISVKEFYENNLFTNFGAALYRAYKNHMQGYAETMEGTFKLGPELEKKWYQIPGELAKAAKDKPMTTAVDFLKGILYDPELLAVGAGGGATRAARMAKSAATASAITGGSEAAKQLAQKDRMSGEEIAGQATTGLAIGGGFGAFTRAPKAKAAEPQPQPQPKPKPSRQAGETDPEMLAWLSAGAGLTMAGQMLYSEYEKSGRSILDIIKNPKGAPPAAREVPEGEPQPTERGTFEAMRDIPGWMIGVGAMAGAVKAKGGMWHPEAVERLSNPLKDTLISGREAANFHNAQIDRMGVPEGTRPSAEQMASIKKHPADEWATKAVRNYLNRWAGTEGDPLKDVEVPTGQGVHRWEELWDAGTERQPASYYQGFEEGRGLEKVPADETIFNIGRGRADLTAEHRALTSYLSHVGDYLRQNVASEKLQQYDLVRAVKETAENDKRVAKQMEKAQAASTKDLPVYKAYEDGFKWVELKLPEKLTEEQAKQVRISTKDERRSYQNETWDSDSGDRNSMRGDWYTAVDSSGKPIKNSYTGDIATGKTPKEAFLAGQLAQEGNQLGHCVGGYCEQVASGESRIFSLRDPKGKSHVTVEVQPHRIDDNAGGVVRDRSLPPDILQIKGKQNRAPNAEYLPYVQDFVRGGKWGEVGDLDNTGLIDAKSISPDDLRISEKTAEGAPYRRALNPEERKLALQKLKEGSQYLTKEEFDNFLKKAGDGTFFGEKEAPRNWREEGFLTVDQAAKLAAMGLGATAGAYLAPDHPYFGAAVGAAALLGALALRKPDSLLRKEVAQSLESMRATVHPAFHADKSARQAAKLGEAVLAKAIAERMQHDSAIYHASEGSRRYWDKLGQRAQWDFISRFEKGETWKGKDTVLEAMAQRYKAWAENIYARESGLGIQYDARDHYLYHSFQDGDAVINYLNKRFGSRWGDPKFTKERGFDLYEEAIRAGFKPKTLNPERIMLDRQYASNIAEMRVNMLDDLQQQGLARTKGQPELSNVQEVQRRAPNGKLYYVDSRVASLLNNAFDTESLWTRKDAIGTGFRAAMEIKNLTVPVALSASLFHPLHISLGMDNSAAMLAANKMLASGAMSQAQWAKIHVRAGNPVTSLYDSFWTNPKAGWRPLQVWKGKVPENQLTAIDREQLTRMFEGGFIPEPGVEWKAKSAEAFTRALDQKDVLALPLALPAIIQLVGKPMMEIWIPQLKAFNYLRDTEAALKSNPKLLEDTGARMVAFRKIAKSVENRFGEMAYSTLFWPRAVKDVGVAMNLSLGWTLGFFREYGGGARELGHGVINLDKKGKIEKGEVDRALFVSLYTANTMLYGGLATWMMTGKAPQEWLDYFYPRTGDKNPDGTPKRVNTMFYSREWLGMFKHMQNEGILSGASQFVLNKVAPTWGIAKGFWTNLDYFSKEISDPNAPAYQRLSQKVAWAMNEISPISVQALKKQHPDAKSWTEVFQKSSAKEIGLAVSGFTPAPRYATETPLEGKISHIYQTYHKSVTPYARARRSDDVRELYAMQQSGNQQAFQEKLAQMKDKYKLSHADTVRLRHDSKVPPTERMFKGLTAEQQTQLFKEMNPSERSRFLPFAHRNVRRKFQQ